MNNGGSRKFSLAGVDHAKVSVGTVQYALIPSAIAEAVVKSGILTNIPVVNSLEDSVIKTVIVGLCAYAWNIARKFITNSQSK